MATPSTPEDWITRIEELTENLDSDTLVKANNGNAAAQAIIKAWAIEMQAAAVFIAGNAALIKADQAVMTEAADTIIDTIQAILLALGIAFLLKKFKKGGKKNNITVSEAEYKKLLGDKIKARPSHQGAADKAMDVAFIRLRMEWLMHFIYTVMKSMTMGASKKELTWEVKKDGAGRPDKLVCSICRAMDGKKSINGNFIPVILKLFPAYKPYTNWMGWPHAHPRCRCEAK